VNNPPRGQKSLLGAKFTPRGKLYSWGPSDVVKTGLSFVAFIFCRRRCSDNNFLRFWPTFGEKLAFFHQINVTICILQNLAAFRTKKSIFSLFLWRKFFKKSVSGAGAPPDALLSDVCPRRLEHQESSGSHSSQSHGNSDARKFVKSYLP
jgi:hypothetical protein